MHYPLGEERDNAVIIGWNCIFNDEEHFIVKCRCGQLGEISLKDFENKEFKICNCRIFMKYEKIIGKEFNSWTIVEVLEKKGTNKYFKCRCVCGNLKDIAYTNLTSGRSKSCGCGGRNPDEPKERKRKEKIEEPDITGLLNQGKGKMAEHYLRSQGLPASLEEMEAFQGGLDAPPVAPAGPVDDPEPVEVTRADQPGFKAPWHV